MKDFSLMDDVPQDTFAPRVSIVIPVYNGSNFLEEAIQSALSQTYGNIEIIVVNDGSNDEGRTEAIVAKYVHRLRYIKQPNKGVAGALNAAIEIMTGNFFTWLSHDDLYLPHKISSQVAYFARIGRADAILFSNYYLMDEIGNVTHAIELPAELYARKPMLPLLRGAINGCTLFIPVDIIRRFGPFDETLRHVQDYDLWNKIIKHHEFFLQPELLVKYRLHPGQDTNKPGALNEANPLWIRMMEERTEVERVHLSGSNQRFFAEMADFLESTPYKHAAAYARKRCAAITEETLVSVVLPCSRGSQAALESVRSVLAQTHRRLELLIVGNQACLTAPSLDGLAASDTRVRLIQYGEIARSAALNRGLQAAAGGYIAFLAEGDLFAPDKLRAQLAAMQEAGSVFSYTSYLPRTNVVAGSAGGVGTSITASPAWIDEGLSMATATVMLHRILVAEGFSFTVDSDAGHDALSWALLSERHDPLCLKEALSVVAVPSTTPQPDGTSLGAFGAMLTEVLSDALLSEEPQLRVLEETLDRFSRLHHQIGTGTRRPTKSLLLSQTTAGLIAADGGQPLNSQPISGASCNKENLPRRPSVLVADIDLHSVVGGGQVLFRNLMKRNEGIDFYFFSRGPDLALKTAGKLPENVFPVVLPPIEALGPFLKEPGHNVWTGYASLALQMAAGCVGRHFDAVDVPSYLTTGHFLRSAFAFFGVSADRIVLGLHGWTSVGLKNQYGGADLTASQLEFQAVEQATLDAADAAYTVSELHHGETQARFGYPINVIDMHDVLDPPALRMPVQLNIRPDLWFVGRLDRNKGPDIFVDIVSRLPRHSFGRVFAAGPDLPLAHGGTCSQVLIDQAKGLGVTIHYEGELTPAVLRERVFNGKTVVIVPSRTDTFNLVALEAITSGTPILLSEAAGSATFLRKAHPEIPIMRMDPENIKAAAETLAAFLAAYPGSALQFRKAIETATWPPFQPDFMKSVYLSGPGRMQKQSPAADQYPYVQLQTDPRTPSDRPDWELSDPRLTIVVPTYCRPEWLINCLASIAQERPKRTGVLVIDDGSPPEMRVPDIVGAYAPFARVISTENRGEANAVNLGIAEAHTPYVLVLSDDDVVDGTWLETAVDELDASGAVLAYPDWAIIDSAGASIEEHRLVGFSLDRLIGDHWCLPGPGTVFRTADALAVGCRSTAFRWVSDYDLWLKLAARGSFRHVPVIGAYWRYHGENATSANDLRYAEEHVGVIAAELQRRREAGAPLPAQTADRGMALSHLAAGVILSRSSVVAAAHAHFFLAYLLSPSTLGDLPCNVIVYQHYYPAWLNGVLQAKSQRSAASELFQEEITMFSKMLRSTLLQYGKEVGLPTMLGVAAPPVVEQESDPSYTESEAVFPQGSTTSVSAVQQPAAPLLDTVPTDELAAAFAARIRDIPGNQFHELFDKAGYHLLRKHFYVPLPDLSDLSAEAWTTPSKLAGVDMNERAALRLMEVVLPRYLSEFRARFPIHGGPDHKGFYLLNASYMAVDAHVLYGLVRHAKPRRIVEIGNGSSTLVAVAAAELNRAEGFPVKVTTIDPYPSAMFAGGYPGLDELIPKKVQDVPYSVFEELEENDIFFIDSSHVLTTGNDVEHEYLNLLPLLKDGVYVHVHDVSLPLPYPKTYFENQLYWNEQQLLQAFLAFNSRFNVIWPGNYMMHNYPEKMIDVFPEIKEMRAIWPSSEPTAFWMRVAFRDA